MNNIYKHRLLLLASFLEQLPKERFNYNHWVGHDWAGKQDLSCGTTACALGWATTIPELQETGLCLVKRPGHSGTPVMKQWLTDPKFIDDLFFPGKSAERVSAEVFGLTAMEHEYLFLPVSQHDGTDWDEGDDGEEESRIWSDPDNDCAVQYGRVTPDSHASAKVLAEHIRFFVSKRFPS